jgi:hypothetical protein
MLGARWRPNGTFLAKVDRKLQSRNPNGTLERRGTVSLPTKRPVHRYILTYAIYFDIRPELEISQIHTYCVGCVLRAYSEIRQRRLERNTTARSVTYLKVLHQLFTYILTADVARGIHDNREWRL